ARHHGAGRQIARTTSSAPTAQPRGPTTGPSSTSFKPSPSTGAARPSNERHPPCGSTDARRHASAADHQPAYAKEMGGGVPPSASRIDNTTIAITAASSPPTESHPCWSNLIFSAYAVATLSRTRLSGAAAAGVARSRKGTVVVHKSVILSGCMLGVLLSE